MDLVTAKVSQSSLQACMRNCENIFFVPYIKSTTKNMSDAKLIFPVSEGKPTLFKCTNNNANDIAEVVGGFLETIDIQIKHIVVTHILLVTTSTILILGYTRRKPKFENFEGNENVEALATVRLNKLQSTLDNFEISHEQGIIENAMIKLCSLVKAKPIEEEEENND